jgi:hypothetical protein
MEILGYQYARGMDNLKFFRKKEEPKVYGFVRVAGDGLLS